MVLCLCLGACTPVAADPRPSLTDDPGASVEQVGPTATPGAGTRFESNRYGYRLTYPPGWKATETFGTGGVHPDEPGVDTFRDTAGHILSVVSEPAPALAGWTCAIARHLEHDHGVRVEASEDLTVGGRPARLFEHHLEISPYVIHYLTVELVDQDRGLTFSMESTTKRDDEDRRTLDALMATIELVPTR